MQIHGFVVGVSMQRGLRLDQVYETFFQACDFEVPETLLASFCTMSMYHSYLVRHNCQPF